MTRISRRKFLAVSAGGTGAAAATYGLQQIGKLVPYVTATDQTRPGVWTVYASTCRECPAGCGMHLRCRDGRACKAEGNPHHPVNAGKLCARGQSALQGLYDPDRISGPRRRDGANLVAAQWDEALAAIAAALAKPGAKATLLSNLQAGTLAEVMGTFARSFGGSEALYVEAFTCEPLRRAHKQLFDLDVIPRYRLDGCEFVLSLAADFLETWLSPVEFARQFADVHSYRDGRIGRLAYVGPRKSMTAMNADEYVQVAPQDLPAIAAAIWQAVTQRQSPAAEMVEAATKIAAKWRPEIDRVRAQGLGNQIDAIARAFASAKGAVALPGPSLDYGQASEDVALFATLLNLSGAAATAVDFTQPHALSHAATRQQVSDALDAVDANTVLLLHECNLAYLDHTAVHRIRKAGMVVVLASQPAEMAELAHWVLPTTSPLESWGDYAPYQGVAGLMQPTTSGVWDCQQAGDLLLEIARRAGKPLSVGGREIPDFLTAIKNRWSARGNWEDMLRQGGRWEKDEKKRATTQQARPKLRKGFEESFLTAQSESRRSENKRGQTTLWVYPHLLLFDGKLSNRGWLQETPDPASMLTWGSHVELHPAKARELGAANGTLLELKTAAGTVQAPVRIIEEIDESVVALATGQGHWAMGRFANGVGANAFALVSLTNVGPKVPHVQLRAAGKGELVAATHTMDQHHREVLQWVELDELEKRRPGGPNELALPLPEGYRKGRDVYPPREYKNHRWAMVVDLQRCIGCGACTAACYAENNIRVVGKDDVAKGRELAWLKVVAYRSQEDNHRLAWIPMLCQHCDAAPCEPVCPVFAAVHNEEGLNSQVYNRCIGTRYCNNNCPYKVRVFNWTNYDWEALRPLDWQLNPEVSVRSRGVMEKCTFCIQRINEVRNRAKRENRPIRDGEVQPACVQTCPTGALIFGDLLNKDARVTQLTRTDPRRYHLLEELNTKPAVTYLQRIHAPLEHET